MQIWKNDSTSGTLTLTGWSLMLALVVSISSAQPFIMIHEVWINERTHKRIFSCFLKMRKIKSSLLWYHTVIDSVNLLPNFVFYLCLWESVGMYQNLSTPPEQLKICIWLLFDSFKCFLRRKLAFSKILRKQSNSALRDISESVQTFNHSSVCNISFYRATNVNLLNSRLF